METMNTPANKGFFGGPPAWVVIGVPLAGVGLFIASKLMGLNPFVAASVVLLLVTFTAAYRRSRTNGWRRAVREIGLPAVPAYLLFLSIGWTGLSLSGTGNFWSYGSLALIAMSGGFLLFTMGRGTGKQTGMSSRLGQSYLPYSLRW